MSSICEANRLGLINISQMLNALVWSVDNVPENVRIVDVPKMRELSREIALSSRAA